MVIRPGFLATRFVFMAGIIGLLKPGRCLRPWNKSDFLDVSATVHTEKDSANGDRQNHSGRGITADTCHGYLPSRIALGSVLTL